jgi:multiple sugar transport system permease protein
MTTMALKRKRPLKQLLSRFADRFIVYFLLIFFAVVALLPFYYLIITAMKDFNEASTMATMWPQTFVLFDNIRFVLSYPDYNVVRMFLNTILIFALKAAGTILTCSLVAYAFAMFKFPFKNVIFFTLLATMMIPGELLNIPLYEFFVNMGLKEVAYIPLWISSWFATDVFVIFMFRQFFLAIPKPLIESARMDGASEARIFFRIVLPMNKPVLITVLLLYFVGTYNDLYGPALYISEKSNWVMANSITIFENMYKSGSSEYIIPWNYVSVASLIAIIPVIFLFAFMQRYFMETANTSGIKG